MKLVILRSCNGMQIHAFVANFVAFGEKKLSTVPPANAPILYNYLLKTKKAIQIIFLMWVKDS